MLAGLNPTSRIKAQPALFAVLALGVVVRAALIPITHGQDFVVWDKASAATLRGVNVYAHHPNYPGGPFAYFPLFIYVELPFQWLAQHTGIPFQILGKLPMLAADLAVAVLIAAELRDRRRSAAVIAIGASVYFLNPLVIYNSAFYGRFDGLVCALLLMALRMFTRGSPRSAIVYALAVAAKTFPGFLFPGIVRAARGMRARLVVTVAVAAVIVVLSLPYLYHWQPFLRDIFWYDAKKDPQALSWQYLLFRLTDSHVAKAVGYLLLALFLGACIWLSRIENLQRYALLVLVLFVLDSKVVLEQYLIWPLPWLALIMFGTSRRIARATIAFAVLLTAIGMLSNPYIDPWGRSPWPLEVALAASCVAYFVLVLRDSLRPDRPNLNEGGPASAEAEVALPRRPR